MPPARGRCPIGSRSRMWHRPAGGSVVISIWYFSPGMRFRYSSPTTINERCFRPSPSTWPPAVDSFTILEVRPPRCGVNGPRCLRCAGSIIPASVPSKHGTISATMRRQGASPIRPAIGSIQANSTFRRIEAPVYQPREACSVVGRGRSRGRRMARGLAGQCLPTEIAGDFSIGGLP